MTPTSDSDNNWRKTLVKILSKPSIKLSSEGLTLDETAYQAALDILSLEDPLTFSSDELAELLRSKYGSRGLMEILSLGLQGIAFKKLYPGNFRARMEELVGYQMVALAMRVVRYFLPVLLALRNDQQAQPEQTMPQPFKDRLRDRDYYRIAAKGLDDQAREALIKRILLGQPITDTDIDDLPKKQPAGTAFSLKAQKQIEHFKDRFIRLRQEMNQQPGAHTAEDHKVHQALKKSLSELSAELQGLLGDLDQHQAQLADNHETVNPLPDPQPVVFLQPVHADETAPGANESKWSSASPIAKSLSAV